MCKNCPYSIFSKGFEYELSEDESYYILTGMGECTDTELYIGGTYDGKPVKEIAREAFYDQKRIRTVVIGNGVEKIGSQAFYGCERLTEVVIGNDVKGLVGFEHCNGIARMTIGSGVTSIDGSFSQSHKLIELYNLSSLDLSRTSVGQYALNIYTPTSGKSKTFETDDGYIFYEDGNTRYLVAYKGYEKELILPESCNGNSYEIYTYAFNDQDEITSVVIPSAVTVIQERAFSYCNHLRKVTIGSGVASIGVQAFYNSTQLVEVYNLSRLNITAGVEYSDYIGSYARIVHTSLDEESVLKELNGCVFAVISDTEIYLIGCDMTRDEITIPQDYLGKRYVIHGRPFYQVNSLKEVTIENSITSINDYQFSECSSLTSVTIPDSVTTIGNGAFQNCTSLTSVTIPDSVTTIGNSAFYNCRSHTSITIPDSVTTIGNGAFYNCRSLTIYCEATSTPSGWDSNWNSSNRPVVWGHTHAYENGSCVCGKTQN